MASTTFRLKSEADATCAASVVQFFPVSKGDMTVVWLLPASYFLEIDLRIWAINDKYLVDVTLELRVKAGLLHCCAVVLAIASANE